MSTRPSSSIMEMTNSSRVTVVFLPGCPGGGCCCPLWLAAAADGGVLTLLLLLSLFLGVVISCGVCVRLCVYRDHPHPHIYTYTQRTHLWWLSPLAPTNDDDDAEPIEPDDAADDAEPVRPTVPNIIKGGGVLLPLMPLPPVLGKGANVTVWAAAAAEGWPGVCWRREEEEEVVVVSVEAACDVSSALKRGAAALLLLLLLLLAGECCWGAW